MTDRTKDLLGNDLTADEAELLDLYDRSVRLAGRTDLPPVIAANVKQAMVLLWNACNDLALGCGKPDCD